jgi:hypothetical protein
MHLHIAKAEMVTDIHRLDQFARQFPFFEWLRHGNANDFSFSHLGQLDRVA